MSVNLDDIDVTLDSDNKQDDSDKVDSNKVVNNEQDDSDKVVNNEQDDSDKVVNNEQVDSDKVVNNEQVNSDKVVNNEQVNSDKVVNNEQVDSDKVVNNEQVDTSEADVVVSENTVHAIIQIDDNKMITVLDAIPDGKSLDTTSPYDLLANKTPSIFAIKIVKKDKCSTTDEKIKCIDFDDSHYEMDLSTPVTTVDKLLNQDFLSTSTETNGTTGTNVVTGGSRKNLRQKSKKTKRKYYVYKK
jgi:hypothetical protein